MPGLAVGLWGYKVIEVVVEEFTLCPQCARNFLECNLFHHQNLLLSGIFCSLTGRNIFATYYYRIFGGSMKFCELLELEDNYSSELQHGLRFSRNVLCEFKSALSLMGHGCQGWSLVW